MPEERFKTKHKCPDDDEILYEEETSLLKCYKCGKEYYTFRGKLRPLQSCGNNYVNMTARN